MTTGLKNLFGENAYKMKSSAKGRRSKHLFTSLLYKHTIELWKCIKFMDSQLFNWWPTSHIHLEATCEWPILTPLSHRIQKRTTYSIGLYLMHRLVTDNSSNFQAQTLVHVVDIIVQSVLPRVC